MKNMFSFFSDSLLFYPLSPNFKPQLQRDHIFFIDGPQCSNQTGFKVKFTRFSDFVYVMCYLMTAAE